MKIEVGNISVKKILLSGSCFRVTLEKDGSFTNILKDRVVNIKEDGNYIYVKSNNYDNLESIIREYFDLNRDYDKINNELINNNSDLKDMINSCLDYRILNQDPFEMCISYIISQNNNVKRIINSIDLLCRRYGHELSFEGKEYYLFPTYDDLKKLTIEDYRSLGVGFRDKYLYDFISNYKSIKNIDDLSTSDALNELMKIKGIGLKVASCILLFGYKRLDVFPIDTWVRHYMVDNYNIKDDIKSIEKFARDNFKEYSGLVIQYMFHSKRNLK